MRRRALPRPKRRPAAPAGQPDLPSLAELDRFSAASLHRWLEAAMQLGSLHRALYFELESLRQRDGPRLIDAVGSSSVNNFQFEAWSRIVDYRYPGSPVYRGQHSQRRWALQYWRGVPPGRLHRLSGAVRRRRLAHGISGAIRIEAGSARCNPECGGSPIVPAAGAQQGRPSRSGYDHPQTGYFGFNSALKCSEDVRAPGSRPVRNGANIAPRKSERAGPRAYDRSGSQLR
jgi:hypothetical protein